MSRPDPTPAARREPLRILHLVRRFAPLLGGIERAVRDLAAAQVEAGHVVTVVTLDHDVIGDRGRRLPRHDVVDGIRVIRVPGFGTRRTSFTTRPDLIARAVRSHDVVHLHDLRFGVGMVAMTTRFFARPWVMHTHGLIFHTATGARFKHLAMRYYYGPLLRAGRAWIVASSDADRARLLSDVPSLADRTTTMENAIPLGRLTSLSRRPEPGRIVAVGRIVRSKGLDDLISALAVLDDVNWTLEVAGDPDADEIQRLTHIASLSGIAGRIHFRGAFADAELGALLATAAVGVFPSRGEGFGLALLEAMAAGLPLAARGIPAHEELLGPDLADLIVDFSRPDEAADAIRSLLVAPADRSEDLSRRLRARASGYDISRLTAQMDELYRGFGLSTDGRRSNR